MRKLGCEERQAQEEFTALVKKVTSANDSKDDIWNSDPGKVLLKEKNYEYPREKLSTEAYFNMDGSIRSIQVGYLKYPKEPPFWVSEKKWTAPAAVKFVKYEVLGEQLKVTVQVPRWEFPDRHLHIDQDIRLYDCPKL